MLPIIFLTRGFNRWYRREFIHGNHFAIRFLLYNVINNFLMFNS